MFVPDTPAVPQDKVEMSYSFGYESARPNNIISLGGKLLFAAGEFMPLMLLSLSLSVSPLSLSLSLFRMSSFESVDTSSCHNILHRY